MQEKKHRRVYADVAQTARERALVPGDAGSIPAIRANRSRVTDAAIIPGVKIGGPVTVACRDGAYITSYLRGLREGQKTKRKVCSFWTTFGCANDPPCRVRFPARAPMFRGHLGGWRGSIIRHGDRPDGF